MKKRIVFGMLGLAMAVIFAGIGLCADNFQLKEDLKKAQTPPKLETPAVPKDAQPKPAGIANMSKNEIITDIKDALGSEDEILNATPGLKAERDSKGNTFYTYNGTKIEDLGKDQLDTLAAKVHQARTRLNTERIERQLETARRIERINAMQTPRTPISSPASVPQPPRLPVGAPLAPRAPSVPRAPSAPPSPPRK